MKTCKDIKDLIHCAVCRKKPYINGPCAIIKWHNRIKSSNDKLIIKNYQNLLYYNLHTYIESTIHLYFPHLSNLINKIKLLQ